MKANSIRDRMAALAYYTISLLLFPFTLIGYLLWVVKLFLSARSAGVSATAQGPLSARWFQHRRRRTDQVWGR